MSTHPIRIACFGDSLTEGYGLNDDESLPAVLQEMLSHDGISSDCMNFGISGETAHDALDRLDHVASVSPDAVIVEFGANDCFVGDPVDEVKADLATIIGTFKKMNIPVLLVGITALTNMNQSYKAKFDPIFRELSSEFDVALFPDILSSYFGNSMLTLMDGMHPNDQGVRAIARDLYPYLKSLIASQD